MIGEKTINNMKYYSMSTCVKKFIAGSNKRTVSTFINFLVRSHVLNRESVQYRFRKKYIYTLNEEYRDLLIDHFYTEPRKIKGEVRNGTIFFDTFMSRVLSRLYLDYELKMEENNFEDKYEDYTLTRDKMKECMLEISLEFYVPKVNM